MRNIILTVGFIILITGCSLKDDKIFMQAYDKNRSYHHHLQKTEKTQLYDGNITKAVLTATYINEQVVDKEYKPDEIFIVSIHIEEDMERKEIQDNSKNEDSNESKEKSFHQEGYVLTLNGKDFKSIQELEIDDPLLKQLSFVSEWSTYYLVTFPHNSRKSFRLVFKSELYGKGNLYFSKVAKYVLTKKAF